QKDSELIIKGESPNEAAVTRFGQSLEFSSGLFSNLNIETSREPLTLKNPGGSTVAPTTPQDPNVTPPEVVAFTIKCEYAKPNAKSQNSNPAPANQVAKK